MNPFRRIATQFNVSLETFLNQVENHEASAECAIREIARAAEKARGRFARVKLDSEKLYERIKQMESDRNIWVDRAKKCRSDEAKALECVRRVQRLEDDIHQTQEQIKKNTELEDQLDRDLKQIDEELRRLRLKRNQLASRQANAEALKAIDEVDSSSVHDINAIFDRWETRIAGSEGYRPSSEHPDSFESEFVREEEKVRLQAKLQELLKQE